MFRKRTVAVTAALLVTAAGAAPAAASRESDSLAGFCAFAEAALSGLDPAKVPARENVVHEDLAGFVASKPDAVPLRTHQYVTYEDEGRTKPVQIRCKTKSADHITASYGTAAARGDAPCSTLNAHMLDLAVLTMTAAERAASLDPAAVVLDADKVTATGAEWVQEHPSLTVREGVLHLQSSALLVGWADPRYAGLPDSFRGNHYCTVAAPSYLKRVLLGQTSAA